MARTINSKVKLEEVFFDEGLYPRSSSSWQTAFIYSNAMKAGAKFPPIILALHNNKKYLVDGKHRVEAFKLLKKTEIDAVVHTGWDKKKIYIEAVKSNIAHGMVLSPFDKRKIALKLMEMKSSNKEISDIIQVPFDKLENFIGQRLINTITGEEVNIQDNERIAKEIGQAIIKSGIKHFAGQSFSQSEMHNIEENQKPIFSRSQEKLLNELVMIIEDGMLDKKNEKIMELIDRLKKLLQGL